MNEDEWALNQLLLHPEYRKRILKRLRDETDNLIERQTECVGRIRQNRCDIVYVYM